LMAQDIGQAGAVNSGIMAIPTSGSLNETSEGSPAQLTNATSAGATSLTGLTQNVSTNATAGTASIADLYYIGETVQVGLGTTADPIDTVKVTAVSPTSLTVAALAHAHAASDPITPAGIFEWGILPTTSTATKLQMFGDITGDGTIVYAEYNCDSTLKQLTRKLTLLSQVSQNPAQVILSNVTNCASTPFQYTTTYDSTTGDTYVSTVGITLTVQSTYPDPLVINSKTGTPTYLTVTKSLLSLQPRNIVLRYRSATVPTLQPTPAAIPKS